MVGSSEAMLRLVTFHLQAKATLLWGVTLPV